MLSISRVLTFENLESVIDEESISSLWEQVSERLADFTPDSLEEKMKFSVFAVLVEWIVPRLESSGKGKLSRDHLKEIHQSCGLSTTDGMTKNNLINGLLYHWFQDVSLEPSNQISDRAADLEDFDDQFRQLEAQYHNFTTSMDSSLGEELIEQYGILKKSARNKEEISDCECHIELIKSKLLIGSMSKGSQVRIGKSNPKFTLVE